MRYKFLSYAREDSAFVLRLAANLKVQGANVWMDQLDIPPGRQWDREVERALNECAGCGGSSSQKGFFELSTGREKRPDRAMDAEQERIGQERKAKIGAKITSGQFNVSNLDSMLQRNRDFAARQSAAGALMPSLPAALPNVKAVIIGCADMRVDPAHVLGIKPGEAVVMRNIGGRITPGLLEQLGLLGRIGEVAREVPGGGGEFHIVVLHHTDCGITRLAGDPAMLTRYFQIQEPELKTKAITDPRAAVAVDVALLRSIPALPAEWLVSGLMYDVATGLVEIVVPPARIRAV
jgi:carbonic anhydrase